VTFGAAGLGAEVVEAWSRLKSRHLVEAQGRFRQPRLLWGVWWGGRGLDAIRLLAERCDLLGAGAAAAAAGCDCGRLG